LKKKILILSGGISKERLISLDTGLQVAKELKKNGYKVKISEPNSNLAKNIVKNWRNNLKYFKKIMPIDYKKVLVQNENNKNREHMTIKHDFSEFFMKPIFSTKLK